MAIDKFQPHNTKHQDKKSMGDREENEDGNSEEILWRDSWLVHTCHPIRALKKRENCSAMTPSGHQRVKRSGWNSQKTRTFQPEWTKEQPKERQSTAWSSSQSNTTSRFPEPMVTLSLAPPPSLRLLLLLMGNRWTTSMSKVTAEPKVMAGSWLVISLPLTNTAPEHRHMTFRHRTAGYWTSSTVFQALQEYFAGKRSSFCKTQ